jgi:hypothetical protein
MRADVLAAVLLVSPGIVSAQQSKVVLSSVAGRPVPVVEYVWNRQRWSSSAEPRVEQERARDRGTKRQQSVDPASMRERFATRLPRVPP